MHLRQPDVAIVGHVGYETVRTSAQNIKMTMPGGAAYHAAVGVRAAGGTASVFSLVGRDYRREFITKLGARAVLRTVPLGPSSRFAISYGRRFSSRTVVAHLGVASQMTEEMLPPSFFSAKCIYLATNLPHTQLAFASYIAATSDVPIAADCIDVFARRWPDVTRRVLSMARIVFLSEAEQRILRYRPADSSQLVILRRSSRGVQCRQGATVFETPVRRVAVVDPTGAGDVFAGAFLSLLARRKPIRSALTVAANIASRSVSRFGSSHLLGIVSERIE